jgi:hypothetical protein
MEAIHFERIIQHTLYFDGRDDGCFTVIIAVPQLIAGYGLLKRKKWARKAGIVASALAALGFPLGTALSIYSFWFYSGRATSYTRTAARQASLICMNCRDPRRIGPSTIQATRRANASANIPPTQPPDWRG